MGRVVQDVVLGVGLLVAAIAGVVYVAAWETFLATTHYPFMENYTAAMIQALKERLEHPATIFM